MRKDIAEAVKQMLVEQAAAVAVGIALSFVTAGIAAAGGAGVAASRITSAANKIRKLIEVVTDAARLSKTGKVVARGIIDARAELDVIA